MKTDESGHEISDELRQLMLYHEMYSIDQLLAISNEKLFGMQGMTMHLMVEIYKIRDKNAAIDQ